MRDETNPEKLFEAPGETATPLASPPDSFPISLDEFARTHVRTREIELMGGFIYTAKSRGWGRAPRSEWVARFDAFRVEPA